MQKRNGAIVIGAEVVSAEVDLAAADVRVDTEVHRKKQSRKRPVDTALRAGVGKDVGADGAESNSAAGNKQHRLCIDNSSRLLGRWCRGRFLYSNRRRRRSLNGGARR